MNKLFSHEFKNSIISDLKRIGAYTNEAAILIEMIRQKAEVWEYEEDWQEKTDAYHMLSDVFAIIENMYINDFDEFKETDIYKKMKSKDFYN